MNEEEDVRVLKMLTLRESQLRAKKLSNFTLKVMKDCIRAFEGLDVETMDALEANKYEATMKRLFTNEEMSIFNQICSYDNS